MSINRHQANGAYRAWSLPAFDEPEGPDAGDEHVQPEAPEPAPPEAPAYALPTAQDIERMYEDARREGLEAGHAEGYAAGKAEGLQAGQVEGRAEGLEAGKADARTAGEAEARALHELVAGIDSNLAALDGRIAEEIVALALEVARQVVGRTLADTPEAVVDNVRRALAQLPQREVSIHLNPDDLGLVREYLAETLAEGAHRLVEDPALGRGGCLLETPGSQLDASLATRWRRVLQGLGHPDQAGWEDDTSDPAGHATGAEPQP